MTDPVVWPETMRPAQILANPVPFTRSGGRSLGGLERTTRTDRGFWEITYKSVLLQSAAQRRIWNALRTSIGGMAGLIAIPVWSHDSNGAASGIVVEMAALASIGDTEVMLRLVSGIDDLSGVRFSFEHALYETGIETLVDGDEWTVPVFPAIRAEIPADTALEFDAPTCMVRLSEDRAMDSTLTAGGVDKVDVGFIEAVDYWNTLALLAVAGGILDFSTIVGSGYLPLV